MHLDQVDSIPCPAISVCAKRHRDVPLLPLHYQVMSARNGDRARFHKDRKRRLHRRQQIQLLAARLGMKRTGGDALSRVASTDMQDEGGPVRLGD